MTGKAINHSNNNFDFLRFWSASFVVWIHCICLLIPLNNKFPENRHITTDIDPLSILSNKNLLISTLGLYLFFFISGYLITKSALSSSSALDYIWKRFLRIWPGLAVCCTLVVFVVGPLFSTKSVSDYFANSETFKYYFRSLILFQTYRLPGLWVNHPNPEVNGSLYTLIYEVQCYVLVLILSLMGVLRKAWSLWLVFMGSIVLGLLVYFLGDSFPKLLIYYLPYSEITLHRTVDFNIFFFAGALFMHYDKVIPQKPLYFLLSTALFVALCWIPGTGSIAKYVGLPYIIYFLSFVKSPDWMRNWAKNGDYSYGIYIYGMPLSQITIYFMGGNPTDKMFLFILISWLLSVAAGWLSWNLVEKQALKFKNRFSIKKQPG